ncbi:MAG: hypothetical protein ABWZ40_03375 [Caulobacterales bacterium]
MKAIRAVCAVLVLSSLAASCGLKGGLERPAPLWGEQAKREYEEQKQAEAAAKAAKKHRPTVNIPVEGATPAGPPVEQIPPATTDTDDNAPLDTNPYDGGGAPPPVEDTTSSTPHTF